MIFYGVVRLAGLQDVDELVQMRWDFSEEDYPNSEGSFKDFHKTCSEFLLKAMTSGDWYIWVAEVRTTYSSAYVSAAHT